MEKEKNNIIISEELQQSALQKLKTRAIHIVDKYPVICEAWS